MNDPTGPQMDPKQVRTGFKMPNGSTSSTNINSLATNDPAIARYELQRHWFA